MKLRDWIFIGTYAISIVGIVIIIGIVGFSMKEEGSAGHLGVFTGCVGGLAGATIISLFINFGIERRYCSISSAIAALIATVSSIGVTIWIYLDTFFLNPPGGDGNAYILLVVPQMQLAIYGLVLVAIWLLGWLIEKAIYW